MHTICLGPPWQTAPTDTGMRHARKFGWPRPLDASERVWLVCDDVPGPAEVRLNGTVVAADASGPFASDITHLLQPRNELTFIVTSEGSLGVVALEVRLAELRAGANSQTPDAI